MVGPQLSFDSQVVFGWDFNMTFQNQCGLPLEWEEGRTQE
jgi:hypothetical protein